MVDSFINDHDKDQIDAFRNMTLDRKKKQLQRKITPIFLVELYKSIMNTIYE